MDESVNRRDHPEPDSADGTPVPDVDEPTIDPERRRLLIWGIGAIGAGMTAAIGVPAVLYATGPTRGSAGEDEWIRLGSASSVEAGASPTLMKATITRRSGYRVEEREVSVFVTTDNGQDFKILSNVCSHLGCRVRWVEDQNGFFCPCHNAVFGPGGEVATGPPPRPLDQFEAKVEEGQLLFRFKET